MVDHKRSVAINANLDRICLLKVDLVYAVAKFARKLRECRSVHGSASSCIPSLVLGEAAVSLAFVHRELTVRSRCGAVTSKTLCACADQVSTCCKNGSRTLIVHVRMFAPSRLMCEDFYHVSFTRGDYATRSRCWTAIQTAVCGARTMIEVDSDAVKQAYIHKRCNRRSDYVQLCKPVKGRREGFPGVWYIYLAWAISHIHPSPASP